MLSRMRVYLQNVRSIRAYVPSRAHGRDAEQSKIISAYENRQDFQAGLWSSFNFSATAGYFFSINILFLNVWNDLLFERKASLCENAHFCILQICKIFIWNHFLIGTFTARPRFENPRPNACNIFCGVMMKRLVLHDTILVLFLLKAIVRAAPRLF